MQCRRPRSMLGIYQQNERLWHHPRNNTCRNYNPKQMIEGAQGGDVNARLRIRDIDGGRRELCRCVGVSKKPRIARKCGKSKGFCVGGGRNVP